MMSIAKSVLVLLAVAGSPTLSFAQVETKPTILVPAEKCPEYVSLLQRYSTVVSKRSGVKDCVGLFTERDRLLRAMLGYGQNSSCYSYGWKGAEVVSLLQGLIDRNHAEKLRCEGWLASGRICQDGSVCAAGTICNEQRLCVARTQTDKPGGSAPKATTR